MDAGWVELSPTPTAGLCTKLTLVNASEFQSEVIS